MLRYTWKQKKPLKLKKIYDNSKNRSIDFKINISVKAMASGEHKKCCASNLLVYIKYLMVASSMLVLFVLSRFFLTIQKDFS